ncbi:hypothetical protein P8452_08924 [Trifolium repens]|nr:hypothetical protein P8452_08924 [Trifolium repens]
MKKSTGLWLSWELSSLIRNIGFIISSFQYLRESYFSGFTMGFVNLCTNEASVQIGIKSPEANIPQLLPQALIYISHGCESFEKDLFHSTSTK